MQDDLAEKGAILRTFDETLTAKANTRALIDHRIYCDEIYQTKTETNELQD